MRPWLLLVVLFMAILTSVGHNNDAITLSHHRYYDEFLQRVPRAEIAEAEAIMKQTFLSVLTGILPGETNSTGPVLSMNMKSACMRFANWAQV